ncbi:8-oxoguanine deaminase [Parvularcula bermudensis]|uniref:8-oxoguanine deaminase n=1 Tax=Parvularcula bermudensis TaxID=208216 RepID=UPI0019308E38|nr:8-oxoguanine deaminase [Parvularcula bermudensis]
MLITDPAVIVTMDDDQREWEGGYILIENGVITDLGTPGAIPPKTEGNLTFFSARDCVVTPGLVNTHHHLFQSITKAVPAALDVPLFGWLKTLYPLWRRLTPEDVDAAVSLGLAELVLSGCTLTSDHHYLYPNGIQLDDTIAAAQTIGVRFHATRGSMSIGQSKAGLPPDDLVEDEAAILKDCERLIERYHDPSDGSMLRIALAPCSPFSVSQELMRQTAQMARAKGVMLHTHLAENVEDVRFSLDRFGCRPGHYAEDLGWVGEDVWHAHCVQLTEEEQFLFGRTRTGVAHCPCSNGRLGSGIAPIVGYLRHGARVGLGVDGSASNDSGDLIGEARQALLMQRAKEGADALSARAALRLATRGGAETLGRCDTGQLAVGMRADLAFWPQGELAAAGAWDPVAALILCAPRRPSHVMVEGRLIVEEGRLTMADEGHLVARLNRLAERLKTLA